MSLSPSHTLPYFLSLLYIHAVFLLVWPLSTLFPLSPHPHLSPITFFPLLPTSGPICHQCGLFCRRDGASDADTDSGGVHAVCSGFLQCLWALHGRRHKEGETPCWRQQRWGRQEEFWESLWQGTRKDRITVKCTLSTEIMLLSLRKYSYSLHFGLPYNRSCYYNAYNTVVPRQSRKGKTPVTEIFCSTFYSLDLSLICYQLPSSLPTSFSQQFV